MKRRWNRDLHAGHRWMQSGTGLAQPAADAAPGTPPMLQLEARFPGKKENTAGIGLKGAAGQ